MTFESDMAKREAMGRRHDAADLAYWLSGEDSRPAGAPPQLTIVAAIIAADEAMDAGGSVAGQRPGNWRIADVRWDGVDERTINVTTTSDDEDEGDSPVITVWCNFAGELLVDLGGADAPDPF